MTYKVPHSPKFCQLAKEYYPTRGIVDTEIGWQQHGSGNWKYQPTGIYQWYRAFNGVQALYTIRNDKNNVYEYVKTREQLLEYDIIYINTTGLDLQLMYQLRYDKNFGIGFNSKTKIVGNLDYGIEFLSNAIIQDKFLMQNIILADLYFAGEPIQRDCLEIGSGRDIPLVFHPIDTNEWTGIKSLTTDIKDNKILIETHNYDFQQTTAKYIYLNLESAIKYEKTIMIKRPNQLGNTKVLYDRPLPNIFKHDIYLEQQLSKARVVLDIVSGYHNQGRVPEECACLRVPCVGSNFSYAQKLLFPKLTTSPNDIRSQRALLDKLLDNDGDNDFYKEVVEFAYKKVEFFNYENCKKRLIKSLEKEVNNNPVMERVKGMIQ